MRRGVAFLVALLLVAVFVAPVVANGGAAGPDRGDRLLLAANKSVAHARVNLNMADEKTLARVNGIGAVLAKEIVKYRAANGPFRSVEDLRLVKGIGETQLKAAKGTLYVQ